MGYISKILLVGIFSVILISSSCKKRSTNYSPSGGQENSMNSSSSYIPPKPLPPTEGQYTPKLEKYPKINHNSGNGPQDNGGNNNNFYGKETPKNNDSMVPEPGTLLLVGIGLALAGFGLRKRKE